MGIKNDYILDLIARLVDGIVESLTKAKTGCRDDAIVGLEKAVGSVLDMDASAALALSPSSLVTMMRLSAVDDSLAAYAVYCLGRAAELYDANCDATGALRRAQAGAVADAFGFSAAVVPDELAEALDRLEA